LPASSNVSTSFGAQTGKVQNDLTAVQRDNAQLSQLDGISGNLNASQATMAVSLASQLNSDASQFSTDEGTLMQIAVRDNSITEADTAIYSYGNSAFSAISSGASALQDLETNKNLDGALGGPAAPAINDMHEAVAGAIAQANNVAKQDAFTVNGQSTVTQVNTIDSPGTV
jgi:hypothetical protein